MHGKLIGAGAEEISGNTDMVAEIEKFEQLEAFFPDRVFFDVAL